MEHVVIPIGNHSVYGREDYLDDCEVYLVTYVSHGFESITKCLKVFDWGDTFK